MLGTISAQTQTSVPDLIFQIKKHVFEKRVRLDPFFRDHDPLRSGFCSEAKFRTALDEAGLALVRSWDARGPCRWQQSRTPASSHQSYSVRRLRIPQAPG